MCQPTSDSGSHRLAYDVPACTPYLLPAGGTSWMLECGGSTQGDSVMSRFMIMGLDIIPASTLVPAACVDGSCEVSS